MLLLYWHLLILIFNLKSMKKILHTFLMVGLVVLGSCTKDEPAPVNPVIGEWLLGNFTITDLSSAFSRWEGANGTALYGEDSYEIILNLDFTYSREIVFNGGLNVLSESGDWEFDGEDIFLDPDGSGNGFLEEFTIVEVDTKDMTLSSDISLNLFMDSFYTNYSETQIDSLFELPDDDWQSIIDTYYKPAALTLVYEFDKTND